MPSTTPQQTGKTSAKSPKQRCVFTSPNVKARVQEKEELCDLNNRLAAYIDRVRSLESQNAKLSAEVHQVQDTRTREVGNVKAMYETELAESRRLLDETSKEKALLKLENNKLNGILSDLRPKLEKEQTSNKQLQDKLRGVEKRLHEKENLLAVYSSEKSDLANRVKDLEAQISELEAKLAQDKEQLEKEIIARIDAENRYQTLKEESQFNAQVHITEVNEARQSSVTQSFNYSVDATDGTHYDGVLRDKLQELREEFDEEAENARQELEDAYKIKFDGMKDQCEKDRIVISKLLEKQGDFKSEVDTLKSNNNVLSSKVDGLQKRISELDNLRVLDREDFKNQLEERDFKVTDIKSKYDDLEAEYETLLGIKIALDMELAAYNKLLEGEEQRLNLSTPEKTAPRRSRKRGHREAEEESTKADVESTATGFIALTDVDVCGKSVTITNTGTEEEDLSGFFVHRAVDGTHAGNHFTFPTSYLLPSQNNVTIWSESQGVKLNPPSEFVLDGDWAVAGNSIETTVVNSESEVIAKYTNAVSDAPRRSRKKQATSDNCSVM